ncbi:MAG: 9-O-acetylesterase, partial [Planctomycetota bacterium]
MPLRPRSAAVLLLSCVLVCSGASYAEVKLPAVISENMVLQRGIKVPIWGTADAGEDITVTLGEQKATAKAGADGKWKVQLGPLEAGGPFTMTVAGKNTLELKNILVGEVWVGSGQSNMQMNVGGCLNAKDDIAAANFP